MAEASVYTTALALQRAQPGHIAAKADKERVAAYWTYVEIYRNIPAIWARVLREADGEEISRRYVPSARSIIEATNRYLGKDMDFVPGPVLTAEGEGSPENAEALFLETVGTLAQLFDREQFAATWNSLKRWTLIRGDGLLQISADPSKPQGSRLSLTELDPATYFPWHDPMSPTRVAGCYVVNLILNDDDEEIAQRVEYQRVLTEEDSAELGLPVGSVWTRMTFWETDGWDDREEVGLSVEDLKPVPTPSRFNTPTLEPLLAGAALPAQITAIPIYHFRNNREGTAPFGVSELQGIESLLAGIIQTATDEDLTVALQGMGVYWTDSGHPVDAQGNEVPWTISPGTMLELMPGGKIGRVGGANDIESLLKHSDYLMAQAQQTTGTPDVATGRVQVEVAESGVALAIQFSPITAKNAEKEDDFKSKLNQLIWDLINGWMPAYESLQPNGAVVQVDFGDPLPVNREAVLKEIIEAKTAGLFTTAYALQLMAEKLGYKIPDGMAEELEAQAQAALDAMGSRLDAAVGTDSGSAAPSGGTEEL